MLSSFSEVGTQVTVPFILIESAFLTKYVRDTELSAGIVSASAWFSPIIMPLIVGLTQ